MESIRKKSIKLTGFLEFLLKTIEKDKFKIVTPSNPEERGATICLKFFGDGKKTVDIL
jgi:kynureninase